MRTLLALAVATVSTTAGADPISDAVSRARLEVSRAVSYDPGYARLSYPGGDVDPSRGVCTDVVVRAFRAAGLDLQVSVHEDVLRAREAYVPWVQAPDASIDHRRVGPLRVWLQRSARSLPLDDAASYRPGDVVIWSFGCRTASPGCYPHHIGLVSDRKGPRGLPLVIHNLGPTPTEDDALDAWARIGHFRIL